MPQFINPIDKISRRENRDVIFASFYKDDPYKAIFNQEEPFPEFDWESDPLRNQTLDWLTANNIAFEPCYPVLGDGILSLPYFGDIYIDAPMDQQNPVYQKVVSFFEKPDGTSRMAPVILWYIPLSRAMKNAHHDDPAYWENLFN